jgi:hypothetical protein
MRTTFPERDIMVERCEMRSGFQILFIGNRLRVFNKDLAVDATLNTDQGLRYFGGVVATMPDLGCIVAYLVENAWIKHNNPRSSAEKTSSSIVRSVVLSRKAVHLDVSGLDRVDRTPRSKADSVVRS